MAPRRGRCDDQALAAERDQLWAEADAWHRVGAPWHLGAQAERELRQHSERYEAHDPWTDRVLEWGHAPITSGLVTSAEVLDALGVPVERQHSGASRRVGAILRRHGWTPARRRHGQPGRYWRRPAPEPDAPDDPAGAIPVETPL